jgi:hypothetical protein
MPPRQDLNAIEVFRNHDHPQRVAVEQCPPGAVMMIDSRKHLRAASAGSILISRLIKGCAGNRYGRRFSRPPAWRKQKGR